ncbi:peptidoglycan bridge formation glycyltransferase FemA/FemB family protein [uncultured Faecalibaculum sp.]|uniref:peptidoglycan bridge formation glycyltransferase FemA/FemB family protein n=1 Tax=uncultured Faecalibaculum sp. TaxID=1729681 RepID=UPI00272E4372|nr:peptidoglycan bridge formation glycyltransferase FemA/FemB family protein [uncultured Faecalibaculum sp.]
MRIEQISEELYKTFIENHTLVNIWQTTMMGDMQEAQGKEVMYLGIYEDTGVLTGATSMILEPSHFGKLHARSPRGPVLDYTGDQVGDAITAIRDFLKHRNVMYWSLDPYAVYQKHTLDGKPVEGTVNQTMVDQLLKAGARHMGFVRGIDNSTEPRWMYIIPTENYSEKNLLASFERKCSRSIRRGLEFGVQVRELSEEELPLLDQMFSHAGDKHDFAWRSDGYSQRLWNAFHQSGAVKFLVAEINLENYIAKLHENLDKQIELKKETEEKIAEVSSKKMLNRLKEIELKISSAEKHLKEANSFCEDGPILQLAAGIFFDYGKEVICLMSGYDDRYAYFCGPYAMHWHMLKHCLESGYERYNLYGISGEFGLDAIDSGVYAFKKGFSGEVWELPGDFQVPVDSIRYGLLQLAKKLRS